MDIQLLTVIEEEDLKTWPAEKWARYQLEPKYDGGRLLYINGEFFSRSGKQTFHHIDHIKAELDAIPNVNHYVLDGELHGNNWNDTMKIARASKSERDGESLLFHVFDCIPLDDFNKQQCDLFLGQRRLHLWDLLTGLRTHVRLVKPRGVQSYQGFKKLYDACLASGCDGAVLKETSSLYEFKRTKTWLKVKPVLTADCLVVGMKEGTGKYKGVLGALEVKPEGADVTTFVSGMTDDQRVLWWTTLPQYQMVGKTIEVKYRGVHKSGRLIEPRFVRVRTDKEVK